MYNTLTKRANDLSIMASVITVLVVSYYATGVYLNYLDIKKHKQQNL